MRVHLMKRHQWASVDEQGAVAIVVAIILVVLLGISAFAVDFGLAYSNKRQLQTSADSAALAAAASLADEAVSCRDNAAGTDVADGDPPIVTDTVVPIKTFSDLESEAEAAGLDYMEANHGGAQYVPASMTIECHGGAVQVAWENGAATQAGLGSVFGAGQIEATRRAVAALDVPPGVGTGLRPFPFCSRYVPLGLGGNPTQVIRVEGPRTGGRPDDDATLPAPPSPAPPVGCPKPGGNWYHANCPGVTNNGNPELKDAIEGGCDNAVVQAVDGTPPAGPPGTAAFTSALMTACPVNDPPDPTVPDDCLNSDPGNFNPSLANSWELVMTRREAFSVPVFCGYPPCNPVAVDTSGAGGNIVNYPIYRIVSVEICGFHFGSAPPRQRYDGLCSDSNMPPGAADANGKPLPYRATEGDNQTNYFLVVFRSEIFAPVFGASTCSVGDVSCDGGLRRTVLVE